MSRREPSLVIDSKALAALQTMVKAHLRAWNGVIGAFARASAEGDREREELSAQHHSAAFRGIMPHRASRNGDS